MFPIKYSKYTENSLQKIRTISLNQHIKIHYQNINFFKYEISRAKDFLFQNTQHSLFVSIMSIFESNNFCVKDIYKSRLQQKFQWLIYKYYPPKPPSQPVHNLITQPAIERTTTINIDQLPEEQLSVLAYGPNFSITPKINEQFLNKVKVDIAHCGYKVRYKESISNGNDQNEFNINSDNSSHQTIKSACPFPYPFNKAPEPCDLELEDKLVAFNNHIIDLISKHTPTPNINRQLTTALKSLSRRHDLHISVSDKCGEFVVTTTDTHKQLTLDHLNQNDIYQLIYPTKIVSGKTTDILNPSANQLINQIKKKTKAVTNNSNEIWNKIVESRNLPNSDRLSLKVSNCNLPCIYVTIKTHKNPPEDFNQHIPLSRIKVRPIISCCNSPTEKLGWLVTHILSPLLDFIPSHLKNLYSHLEHLRSIPQHELTGLNFFTADVTSLYTNINIESCIDNIIDFASEHIDNINLMGLTLTDIHITLEHVLSNTYFTFDHKLYRQLDGLFMGMMPSPLGAIIRLYYFERNSIYIDIHHFPLFYGRYVDDAGSLATDLQSAQNIVTSIADQDPEGKITWEIDFPQDKDKFIPFLNSEIRITSEGTINSRLYRKPQKKLITLHNSSHHPESIKNSTIRNSYREARSLSSGESELEHSLGIVDELYHCNGYNDPRQHDPGRSNQPKSKSQYNSNFTTLTMDYISEFVSNSIRNHIKSNKLPIRLACSSGNKLKNHLCSSRPYDRPKCTYANCSICPNIVTRNKDCVVKCVVYKVICNICKKIYIGETGRSAHERLSEHLRYAKFPDTSQNSDKALALHYKADHDQMIPDLSYEILKIEPYTQRRKMYEALFINNFKPELNLRDEMRKAGRYLTVQNRTIT